MKALGITLFILFVTDATLHLSKARLEGRTVVCEFYQDMVGTFLSILFAIWVWRVML